MTNSLHAFLSGLIDYAGLFPPAGLDMPAAVATYARHLGSDHAWMVSRFVCPLARLPDFAGEARTALRGHAPVRLAGLGSPMAGIDSMTEVATADAFVTKEFEREGLGVVDALETRLPEDLFELEDSEIAGALERYETTLQEGGMHVDRIYYEIGRDASWTERVRRSVDVLASDAGRGFKIRCGGLTPEAYPTPREVATAIAACARAGVPFKATAGLHHPVRHLRDGVIQHGFLNVFVAGVLATEVDLGTLEELIEDRDVQDFTFADEYLAWRGRKAPANDIRIARETFAISYGSCDVDDPVNDLTVAGLL